MTQHDKLTGLTGAGLHSMFGRGTVTCTQQYLISANMSDRSNDANTGQEILGLAEQHQEVGISAMPLHTCKLRMLMHNCVNRLECSVLTLEECTTCSPMYTFLKPWKTVRRAMSNLCLDT